MRINDVEIEITPQPPRSPPHGEQNKEAIQRFQKRRDRKKARIENLHAADLVAGRNLMSFGILRNKPIQREVGNRRNDTNLSPHFRMLGDVLDAIVNEDGMHGLCAAGKKRRDGEDFHRGIGNGKLRIDNFPE